MAKAVGLEDVLRHPDRVRSHVITTVGHFGYGAVVGALYPPAARRLPGSPVVKGAGFGLLVWAASYLGWLPAADVRHSSLRDAPSRNAVMILAHLVWGGTLGCISGRAEQLISRDRTRAVAGRARA